MKIIKYLWKLRLFLIVFLCFYALPAKTNPVVETSKDVTFNCIEDEPIKYFCTNVSVTNPTIVLQLSRFERKRISRYVNAFRIIPSLTNRTNKTIRSAKVRLTFWKKPKLSKIFIINQKLIPNSQSHTNLSYLIRSDVPVQALLYNELLSTWKNASYDQLILELVEVKYQE
jgi:hypothetical protein